MLKNKLQNEIKMFLERQKRKNKGKKEDIPMKGADLGL